MFTTIVAPLFLMGLTACLPRGTSVVSLHAGVCGSPLAANMSARALLAEQVARLGMSRDKLHEMCASAANYVCTRALFSPIVSSGRSTATECSTLDALGSPCLKIESQDFNTRAAADAEPAKSTALDPGGEYNHAEYTCYNSQVRDSGAGAAPFPASALQAPSLDEALKTALEKCNELALAVPL